MGISDISQVRYSIKWYSERNQRRLGQSPSPAILPPFAPIPRPTRTRAINANNGCYKRCLREWGFPIFLRSDTASSGTRNVTSAGWDSHYLRLSYHYSLQYQRRKLGQSPSPAFLPLQPGQSNEHDSSNAHSTVGVSLQASYVNWLVLLDNATTPPPSTPGYRGIYSLDPRLR